VRMLSRTGLRLLFLFLPVLLAGFLVMRPLLSALETALLYFPVREPLGHPIAAGLSAEELRPRAADGTHLHGWWLRAPSAARPPPQAPGTTAAGTTPTPTPTPASRPVVIWFSGNGGNVGGNLANARRLVDRLDVEIVAVDYRGYGHSDGAPTEAGLYQDGRAIYDAVAARGVPPSRIVLFGRSLGAAVAADVALDRPAAALVLETPFLSVPAVARRHYPFIPSFLIQSRYDTAGKLPRLKSLPTGPLPLLIVQAQRDEVVPPEHAARLYALAPSPKRLHVLAGSRHNDTFGEQRPDYFAAWRDLLAAARTR